MALPAAGRAGPARAARQRCETRIHTALAQMLDRLSALPELRPAIAALHDRTFDDLSSDELAERLERVTNLIGEQRTSLLREKREIEDMLLQIDSRLEAISAFFAFEDQERTNTRDSSSKLNMLVMGEVNEISTDMTQAGSLNELRGRVGNRLEAINTHLSDFRNREEERLNAQVDRTMSLRKRVEELEQESRVLQNSLQEEQRAAMIDALTGIANRAAYDDRMAHEFARWQRHGGTITIAAWDVDNFKSINDEFGHMAGDKVLRILGQHMARSVRGTDFLARYGGEEFVMIMVGHGLGAGAEGLQQDPRRHPGHRVPLPRKAGHGHRLLRHHDLPHGRPARNGLRAGRRRALRGQGRRPEPLRGALRGRRRYPARLGDTPMSEFTTLMARDGHEFSAWLAAPAGKPRGAVVVIQEIFGVNAHIRAVADGYAAEGYVAIAPALFDRVRKGIELDYNAETMKEGIGYVMQLKPEKTLLDLAASLAVVKHAGRVGAVGFCWGGKLAYVSGCELPIACGVAYYGGGIAKELDKTPNCPMLYHFGGRDTHIPQCDIEADPRRRHARHDLRLSGGGTRLQLRHARFRQ